MTNAYITLLYSVDYLPGSLTLAKSLKEQSIAECVKLVILIATNLELSYHQLDLIEASFDEIIYTDLLTSQDLRTLGACLKRPELLHTFTKLQIFKLTQFEKIVFLDSDMLVLQNIDNIFDLITSSLEIVASPDSGWPDIFNSGLFGIKPCLKTYEEMLLKFGSSSFDGADQGFLNEFFQPFGILNTNNIRSWKRLSFLYNVTPNKQYEYTPAFTRFEKDIKILHFIGSLKPWNLAYYSHEHDNKISSRWWSCFNKYFKSLDDVLTIKHVSSALDDIDKFNLAENFKDLEISGAKDVSPEPSAKSDNIIDLMFKDYVKPERHFGPETF